MNYYQQYTEAELLVLCKFSEKKKKSRYYGSRDGFERITLFNTGI